MTRSAAGSPPRSPTSGPVRRPRARSIERTRGRHQGLDIGRPDDQGLAQSAVRQPVEDDQGQRRGHDVRQRRRRRGAADPVGRDEEEVRPDVEGEPGDQDQRPGPGPATPGDVARQHGDDAVRDDARQDQPERNAGVGELGAVHDPDQPRPEEPGRDRRDQRDRQGRPGQDRRDPAGIELGIDRPAEHHGAHRVRDVPQRLGQPAGDRVDAGLADAEDDVDEEGVAPELEPFGQRPGQRPGPEPQLLGEQSRRRPEPERVVARRDPQDQDRGDHQRDQVEHEGDVEAEAGDGGDGHDHRQQDPAPRDPDEAVRDDLLAPQQGEQPDREEQLAGEGQRRVGELRGRQVRDQVRERPVRRAGRRHAVQPQRDQHGGPADDRGPDERVGHPLAGRLAVTAGDDREGLVHPPADDQRGELRVEQDEGEATLGRRTEQPGEGDVRGEDQDRQPEPGDDRDERIAQQRGRGPARGIRRRLGSGRRIG